MIVMRVGKPCSFHPVVTSRPTGEGEASGKAEGEEGPGAGVCYYISVSMKFVWALNAMGREKCSLTGAALGGTAFP